MAKLQDMIKVAKRYAYTDDEIIDYFIKKASKYDYSKEEVIDHLTKKSTLRPSTKVSAKPSIGILSKEHLKKEGEYILEKAETAKESIRQIATPEVPLPQMREWLSMPEAVQEFMPSENIYKLGAIGLGYLYERPGNIVRSVVEELQTNPKFGAGLNKAVQEGITTERKVDGADLVENMGIKNKAAQTVLGIWYDITTEPLIMGPMIAKAANTRFPQYAERLQNYMKFNYKKGSAEWYAQEVFKSKYKTQAFKQVPADMKGAVRDQLRKITIGESATTKANVVTKTAGLGPGKVEADAWRKANLSTQLAPMKYESKALNKLVVPISDIPSKIKFPASEIQELEANIDKVIKTKNPGIMSKLFIPQDEIIINHLKRPDIWYKFQDAKFYAKQRKDVYMERLDNAIAESGKDIKGKKAIEFSKFMHDKPTNVPRHTLKRWLKIKQSWEEIANEMHDDVTKVQKQAGMKPMGKMKHYFHRRLLTEAGAYLQNFGSIPLELQKVMDFIPASRMTISEIMERMIKSEAQEKHILAYINKERGAKNKKPLKDLFDFKNPIGRMKGVIHHETSYPRQLEATKYFEKNPKDLNAHQYDWVQKWIKNQIIGRPTYEDRLANHTLNWFNKTARTLGFNMGTSPVRKISSGLSHVLHVGVLGGNWPLWSLNLLQRTHNLILNGPGAFLKATKIRIYPELRKISEEIMSHSRLRQGRYPMPNIKKYQLSGLESAVTSGMKITDAMNVNNGLMASWMSQYKHNTYGLKDNVNRRLGLLDKKKSMKNVLKEINSMLKEGDYEGGAMLDNIHKADYDTSWAQWNYHSEAMPALNASSLGQLINMFKSWPESYTFKFTQETFRRTFKGVDGLGNKVKGSGRLAVAWALGMLGIEAFMAEGLGIEYVRKLYPWNIVSSLPQTIYKNLAWDLIFGMAQLGTGLITANPRLMKTGFNRLDNLTDVLQVGAKRAGIIKPTKPSQAEVDDLRKELDAHFKID